MGGSSYKFNDDTVLWHFAERETGSACRMRTELGRIVLEQNRNSNENDWFAEKELSSLS
jgi:hypothetical protein